MAKNIHVHLHTNDDGEKLYQSEARAAKTAAEQALSKVVSFAEKLYKESDENNEHGINARNYLERAVAKLGKV